MFTRIISGSVLLVLLFAVILTSSPIPFFLFFGAASLFSIQEYQPLLHDAEHSPTPFKNKFFKFFIPFFITIASLIPFLLISPLVFEFGKQEYAYAQFHYFAEKIIFYAILMLFMSLAVYRRTQDLYLMVKGKFLVFFCGLINSAFFFSLFLVRYFDPVTLAFNPDQSPLLFAYVICLVVFADSGAYFVGKSVGRTKMSPLISPNKTLEGLFGGLVSSALFAAVFSILFDVPGINTTGRMVAFIVISMAAVLFAVHGDLVESFLKRRVNVKDSGKIIPGHGGVLDRIDSLAPAFIIVAYYWLYLVSQNFFKF